MLVHLSLLSLILWIVTLCAQAALAVMVRRADPSSHPIFKWYSYLYFAGATGAFLVAASLPPMWYVYAYLVVTIGGDLLTFFVAQEAYALTFGPPSARPAMVPARTKLMVGMAFTLAVAIGAGLHAANGGRVTRYLVTVEQVMTVGAWAIFMVLITYSRTLRISWPRRTAGISFGFVLYLTINIVAVFFRAFGNTQAMAMAGHVGQIAYLLSCIWWTVCFLEKEPQAVALTAEQVSFMKERFIGSLEALRGSGVQVDGEELIQ